ncbi:MAG TPA: 50S ribosomal protein L3 [Candidatus Dormibacteraeota bacterium]|nr:50S ribosomal protein L3 [Candidatus Dormibacteraeota bacterium]
MPAGLIGRKLGMTRIFADDGSVVPVSVILATPNSITRLRTPEQDGYAALQLGAGIARRLTKPVAGQFAHLDKTLQKPASVREVRVDAVDGFEVGQTLDVSLFEPGDLVDVIGVSKGRGFAGTIARHHFKRGPKSHGSNNYRQPGSIGAGTTPGRVFKGTPMSGHMGDERVTVKKLTVIKVDAERNLILVKGAVPGARNGLLIVQKAK